MNVEIEQVNLFDVDFMVPQASKTSEVVLQEQVDGSQRAVIQGDSAVMSNNSEAHPEAAQEVASEPTRPGFTEFWRAYEGAVKEAEERLDSFSSLRFGALSVGQGLGESFNGHYMLRQTRETLIEAIYRMAEREFAPSGAALSIERESNEIMGKDHEFDPDRLWLVLEQKYGGKAGVELGYKQLAKTLVKHLGLRGKPPVRKTNRIEFQQSAHVEAKFRGGWNYSYSSYNWIRETLRALEAFCVWAEDPVSAMKLDSYVRSFGHYDEVNSRERIDLGSVQVVTFLKSTTYELLGELGEKFHEFIATYGSEALTESRF